MVSAIAGLRLKKRAAQLLLQPDNGVGQRRLGDAAASGCPRETALLAQRQKISKLVHFHGPTHVASIALAYQAAIDVGLGV